VTRRPSAQILAFHPYRGGCGLDLRCSACGHAFSVRQGALGGVVFGRHACPGCATEHDLFPDEFAAAVSRVYPVELAEGVRVAEAATVLTQSWHRNHAFRELLCYRGVDLGPPTERELLSAISEALDQLVTLRETEW